MKIGQFVSKSVLFTVNATYQSLFEEMSRRLKEETCTFLEAIILISIFFEPEESVIPSDLASRLNTTRGNISHCVSSLERAHLIKRVLDQKDARKYRLAIRPEGKRKAHRLMKIIDLFENQIEDRLSKTETVRMIKLLQGVSVPIKN